MAGIVNSPIKWTPKDKPIMNEMSNNQRSPLGLFMSCSHRRLNQKRRDSIKVAMA